MSALTRLLIALVALLTGFPAQAGDAAAAVDELFASSGVQPGAAVLVIDDGKTLIKKGYGYANLKQRTRITPESSFRLASVSKQFTTAAVIALAEDGTLDYDDLLVEHVPELASWPGVTIRHLMTHTSGIPDYYERDYYGEYPADGRMPENGDLIDILSRYPEPDFAPGEKYVYNNAAYELLVVVVERASGRDFAAFLEERVFRPAGMETATTFNSSRPDIPNRVIGYSRSLFRFKVNDYDPFNDMLGAGGVYASLHDFEAWAQRLANNSPFPAEAFEPAVLNDGSVTDYGFGWEIDSYDGHARRAHSGSWVGFRTGIARYPDEDLTIVVLTNHSGADTDALINELSDIFLAASTE